MKLVYTYDISKKKILILRFRLDFGVSTTYYYARLVVSIYGVYT